MNSKILVLLMLLLQINLQAQNTKHKNDLSLLAELDFNKFANTIAGESKSDFHKAENIATWFATNFDWLSTDYKKRSPKEIIRRKGGNCNDLAIVTIECFKELNIKYRKVKEINLHVNTPRRKASAERKIEEIGNRASVFGQRHNDHVWIEVFDSETNQWYPADPSMGAIGKKWVEARYSFGERFTLNPISKDMIAPFAVIVLNKDNKIIENRSSHYAVTEFNKLYDNKLETLPSWQNWRKGIELLSLKAEKAFKAEINLHNYLKDIENLWKTYYQLKEEYQSKFRK